MRDFHSLEVSSPTVYMAMCELVEKNESCHYISTTQLDPLRTKKMQRANNLPAQLSRIRLINVKAVETAPVRLHIALIPGFLNQIVSSSTLEVKHHNLISYTILRFISISNSLIRLIKCQGQGNNPLLSTHYFNP